MENLMLNLTNETINITQKKIEAIYLNNIAFNFLNSFTMLFIIFYIIFTINYFRLKTDVTKWSNEVKFIAISYYSLLALMGIFLSIFYTLYKNSAFYSIGIPMFIFIGITEIVPLIASLEMEEG